MHWTIIIIYSDSLFCAGWSCLKIILYSISNMSHTLMKELASRLLTTREAMRHDSLHSWRSSAQAHSSAINADLWCMRQPLRFRPPQWTGFATSCIGWRKSITRTNQYWVCYVLFLIDCCSKLVYSMIRHERRAERNCWRKAQRRSTPTMEPQKRGAPNLRANRSSHISAAYEETGFNHARAAAAAVVAAARAAGRDERIWRSAAGSRARLGGKGKRFYHGRCGYYPQKQWIISLNYPFHCSRT